MKHRVEFLITFLIFAITVQRGLCDELSNTSVVNNWACTCSSSHQGNQTYIISNCSGSCNCSLVSGGSDEGTWTCMCAANGLPKVMTDSKDTTCFTACNCTTGSLTKDQASRNNLSRKVVVVVLLLCVILTTLAFLASAAWYIYRKDKCLIHVAKFSSDRETSYNSATDLINHRAPSVPENSVSCCAPCYPISEYFLKNSMFDRRKAQIFHGMIVQFSYFQLESATNKFCDSNLIGLGGSSFVYRGQLKDGKTVAVKRLKYQAKHNADSLFLTEVQLLSRLHHCHIVSLLGYCSEYQGKHSERLLVFEYMPHGNLRGCMDGSLGENMNWETRVTIAIGAAKGLEYLHEAAAPRILHRDVKSTNILLDSNWGAKITDLGMAKCLRADGVPCSSSSPPRMQGTFGYFAPEYAMVGRASLMSDVFSFGVVLLELITGRQPINKSTKKGDESLVLWATPRLQDSKRVISELPDPRLKGNFPEEEMQIMAYLAKECLLLDADTRPTMSEVVQILSTIVPDKSKRRNIPVNLFQMSSSISIKTDLYKEKADTVEKYSVDATQLRREKSIRQLSPHTRELDTDRGLIPSSNIKEINDVSTECMEKLIYMASKSNIWHPSDDEIVDLTEPRFESFTANISP